MEYLLYLESGPQHRKTMVHVPQLLGCMANGPTTELALEATPEAIRAYLRFLKRHGEEVDPKGPFETRVAEHITEGMWLGNGSPYVTYEPDLEPVSTDEIEMLLGRFHALTDELTSWAETQTDAQLDARPETGRTARHILFHSLGSTGGYLSAALGGAAGFSRIRAAGERGQIALIDAMWQIETLAEERVRATTPEERAFVRQRPKEIRTLRKALRRVLEHAWEHLVELSRRPGGPKL